MARIVEQFPLLVPCDDSFTTYAGYIDVKGYQFWIRVSLKGEKGPLLDFDWQLEFLLKGLEDALMKKLKECSRLLDFLLFFQQFVEDVLESRGVSVMDGSHKSRSCALILSQLEDLGWDKVKSIGNHFSSLVLVTKDECQREHSLELHLPLDYPSKPPVVHANLPRSFTPKWRQKSSLTSIVKEFEKELSIYQSFWNVLEEIDSKLWVLVPKSPSMCIRTRLFVLGRNVFAQVALNPLHPRQVPEIKFVGSQQVVADLKKRFNCTMDDWSDSLSLVENLEKTLQLKIPLKHDLKMEDVCRGCGVCLEHIGEEQTIPEVFCSVQKCEQAFHKACIVQWIQSRPDSRRSFNTLIGECPYCKQPLQVVL